MLKSPKDPFSRLYQPTDRGAIDSGIKEFLAKGGRVIKLKDSVECLEILKRRERRQIAAERRREKENPHGVIGGIPLGSKLDVLTVKD
jgi:hypothetical protein